MDKRARTIVNHSPSAERHKSVTRPSETSDPRRDCARTTAVTQTAHTRERDPSRFVDFPRPCRLVDRNGYLPRAFAMPGQRLVYSVGIRWLTGSFSRAGLRVRICLLQQRVGSELAAELQASLIWRSRRIGRGTAAGDDTMQVRMVQQRLSPSVGARRRSRVAWDRHRLSSRSRLRRETGCRKTTASLCKAISALSAGTVKPSSRNL